MSNRIEDHKIPLFSNGLDQFSWFSVSILLDRPVEPEALARRRPARPAGALLRLRLGYDGHAERFHAVLVDALLRDGERLRERAKR